jgi:hypothetical protein
MFHRRVIDFHTTFMPTHTRLRIPALVSALAILLSCAPPARSCAIDIGFVSFDVLIPPAGDDPGVNIFDTYNFTGDPNLSGFALPPDFPVLTFVTLQDVSLLFNSTESPDALPDIAPGQLDQGSAPRSLPATLSSPRRSSPQHLATLRFNWMAAERLSPTQPSPRCSCLAPAPT